MLITLHGTGICQARNDEKLSCTLVSLSLKRFRHRFFGDSTVNVRALEVGIHFAGNHFAFNPIHSQTQGINFQADPWNIGRTGLLIKTIGCFQQTSNLMSTSYHLFLLEIGRIVGHSVGPFLPILCWTQVINFGRHVGIAEEFLIPAHSFVRLALVDE